jgi:heme/copper-type cytochrome/quinol oxidase subunit 4
MEILRQTRRRIAYWLMFLLTLVIFWMIAPGDIEPLEQALAMVVIPSIVGGIIAFITGETYSDHSERKHRA